MSIFRRKTLDEQLRENKRLINRAIRELDRERAKLEMEEQKTIKEIKAMAQKGQLGAAKIMAKDIVRTRSSVQKFIKMKAQMQAVSLRLTTLKSTQSMMSCMGSMTKAMTKMNKAMNIPSMQKILMEFEKTNEQMDMKQEMMGDTVDDIFNEDGQEEDADTLLNSVLDELGIQMNEDLAQPSLKQPVGASAVDDLEARMAKLRE